MVLATILLYAENPSFLQLVFSGPLVSQPGQTWAELQTRHHTSNPAQVRQVPSWRIKTQINIYLFRTDTRLGSGVIFILVAPQ